MSKRKPAMPYNSYLTAGFILSFMLVLAILLFGVLGVVYLYLNPSELIVQNSSIQVTANGITPTPVTIRVNNMFHTPISNAEVLAVASKGKINSSCNTDSDGVCSLYFIPVKSLSNDISDIELTAGSVKYSFSIAMNSDVPAKLIINRTLSALPADGYS